MYNYTLPTGQTVPVGTQFSLGSGDAKINYPSNWLEHATLEELTERNILRELVVAPAAPPPTKAELHARAAERRRALANGQTIVTIGDRSIPTWTDADSRGAITGLVVAAGIVPTLTTNWKGADGAFYTLDAEQMVALAFGIMGYVDACFVLEYNLSLQIEAGTITTHAQIDNATL